MDCTLKVRDHGLRTKRLRLEVAHLKSETKGCTLKVRVQGLHTYNRDQGLLVLVPKTRHQIQLERIPLMAAFQTKSFPSKMWNFVWTITLLSLESGNMSWADITKTNWVRLLQIWKSVFHSLVDTELAVLLLLRAIHLKLILFWWTEKDLPGVYSIQ